MTSVQIKRKRGQDPLEALMIKNQGADERLVFKLAGTFDEAIPDGDANFTLQETSEQRVFKRRKGDNSNSVTDSKGKEPELPPQLQEMVSNYISADSVDAETEDYVYDVYFGSKSTKELDSSVIGYIVLDEEDREVFMHEAESESDVYTADEDSNAEDFYQNDYPDEEESFFDSLDEFDDLDLSGDDDLHYSPESD